MKTTVFLLAIIAIIYMIYLDTKRFINIQGK